MSDARQQGDDASAYAESKQTHQPALLIELREHVPFSVSAVALGLIAAGTICILGSAQFAGMADHAPHGGEHASGPAFARLSFHLFHPAHMFFSAVATTTMFCRYERRILKAIMIGLIGAIGVCGISDTLMPHVSLLMLGVRIPLHLCVVDHPDLVLPFAAVGVLVGIGTAGATVRTTILSHSMHVFASSMASIFYMVGPLGTLAWIDDLGKVFGFVVLAVLIPCCLSDIVFPLFMSRAGRNAYEAQHCEHA